MTMSDGVPSGGGESVDQVCLSTRIEMDRPVNLVRRPPYMRPRLLSEAVAALQDRPWSILAVGTAFYSAPQFTASAFAATLPRQPAPIWAPRTLAFGGAWRVNSIPRRGPSALGGP
jgi:hypothetical protein